MKKLGFEGEPFLKSGGLQGTRASVEIRNYYSTIFSPRAVVTGTLEEHYWCFKKVVISSICNSSELNQKMLPKQF